MVKHSRCVGMLALLAVIPLVTGHNFYKDRIPNGDFVPHPCKPNILWKGVGHTNQNGGGARNPFGEDFQANGHVWDETLCRMDSDGDGKSNGEELGDPFCVWTPGTAPQRSIGLSHPGVCDPFDSGRCGPKPEFVTCESEEFKCDAVHEPETLNVTVRIPATPVPAKETTYVCMLYDLPVSEDTDYHMVALQPIIDNADVMHHIVLRGCAVDQTVSHPSNEVFDCNMSADDACVEIIGLWTVGVTGQCAHPDMGYRIGGLKGFKKIAMEFHWNNPQFRADYTDRSGLVMFLTPNLRPYDAGVLMIGQEYLEIPPGSQRHEEQGSCPSSCTQKKFTGSISIVSTFNHMHYMGIAQKTDIIRGGRRLQYLANDEVYSYDSPVQYEFPEPVTVQPGDELRTRCFFKTTSKDKTTYFGEATSDEMCIAFLTYYPKQNIDASLPDCISWRGISRCDWEEDVIQGCNRTKIDNYMDPDTQAIYQRVNDNCSPSGVCLKECLPVVREIKEMACFKNDYNHVRRYYGSSNDAIPAEQRLESMKFYARLDSCDAELAREEECPKPKDPTTAGAQPRLPTAVTLAGALLVYLATQFPL